MEMGPFSEKNGKPTESTPMLNFKVRRLSERPRMLVFMLGVMLPAAALIVAGVWHLRNIQREQAIEAVLQREYQQLLTIAGKRIDARAYDIAEDDMAKFPKVDQEDELG